MEQALVVKEPIGTYHKTSLVNAIESSPSCSFGNCKNSSASCKTHCPDFCCQLLLNWIFLKYFGWEDLHIFNCCPLLLLIWACKPCEPSERKTRYESVALLLPCFCFWFMHWAPPQNSVLHMPKARSAYRILTCYEKQMKWLHAFWLMAWQPTLLLDWVLQDLQSSKISSLQSTDFFETRA